MGDEMIVKGKTKSGFKFEVESKRTESWKFMDAIKIMKKKNSSDEAKVFAVMDLAEIILGDDGLDALQEHLAQTLPQEDLVGGVSTGAMLTELTEIFEKIGGTEKNSIPSQQ